jgi:type VI secretion system protein ImpL
MVVYLVTGLVLLVYLVLVWFVGAWMHPPGAGIWILRGGLAFIGLIAAGSFLWFYRKTKVEESGGESATGKASDDLDVLVHEAVRRLKTSALGRGSDLRNLPLVFLLGDSGATKTTTIVHSALDPELLAGQVYQDNNIVPTRVANIWYTRQAIFVDPAGTLLAESGRWKRLVKLVQPGRFSNAMGKGQQAPRAAIVCYDCENFMRPGASETTLSAARKLAVRLQEVSHLLGISFPVYVLFTKLDRISFFPDFARGLSKEEASEVLGATLPVRLVATGVYAEEETRRLAKAFDELFYSLAERRLDLLGRENEGDKLPGIYEFPRELRKLRTLLVQFLVDLARPSQLSINPFLRGFYFSGVRPVIVGDVAAAVAVDEPQTEESGSDAGATRIFSGAGLGAGKVAAPVPLPARVVGSRKVPQWVFLSQFFNDVIVKDRVALAASGFSSRVSLLRRVALTSVVLVGLVCAVGFLVSFFRNHALENDVSTAINQLRTVQVAPNHVPSLSDLQKLDRLRQQVVTLSGYQNSGIPLNLRWGLYVGDQIYPDARNAYFQHFQKLLFADAQGRLLTGLRGVPVKPGSNDTYDNSYNELKAYLVTTSNNDKSTKEFLSPVLTNHWTAGREKDIGSDSIALAKMQFDFYSKELATINPFSSNNDPVAIARARKYISLFGSADRLYATLVEQASLKNPAADFYQRFQEATGVIVGARRVRGAFTRPGFAFMKDAILNPSAYASGEEWVLGKATALDLDQATLQQKLTERYQQDFINEWHAVLHDSSVAAYKDLNDAESKLGKLASSTSPLLELLWFISNNTDVGAANVTAPFLPVQAIEPPGPPDKMPDKYVLPNNEDYVLALSKLQSDVGALAQNKADPSLAQQALASATAAKNAVTKIVVGAPVDQKFHDENLVEALLREPINNVVALLAGQEVGKLNAAAGSLCAQFAQLGSKYPFNPDSAQDLPVDQLNSILAPKTGALWTFYDNSLAKYLSKQGSRYVEVPDPKVRLLPAFVYFFNRAATFSDALYPGGSVAPKFAYNLKAMPSNVDTILKIGSDTLSGVGQQKTFTWTGAPEDVQVTTKGGDILGLFSGPWSVFKFVADAHSQLSGPVTTLEWIMQSNGRTIVLPSGKPKSYSYELQVVGLNPFRTSDLSGLRCQVPIAH